MSSWTIGIVSVISIFGSTLLGMWLRTYLPGHHLREESKDTIKVGAGMIATLGALVLGLLVGSAKSSFDATSAALTQSAAKIIQVDRALAQYGPETREVRATIRGYLTASIQLFWPEEPTAMSGLQVFEAQVGTEAIMLQLEQLTPNTEMQRHLLAQSMQICNDLTLARWLLVESAHNDLPLPLVAALVLWLSMLFMSFGLLAPRNATVLAVLFVCACSVSTALYLISEMNQPLTGTIHVSGAPMHKALQHLNRG